MIYITYAYRREIAELAKLVADRPWRCRFVRVPTGRSGESPGTALTAAIGHESTGGTGASALILNAGFAGALAPHLGLGEIVFIEGFAAQASEEAPPETSSINHDLRRLCLEKKFRGVRCLTSVKAVEERETRDLLRQTTGADVVDMEARFLYEVARRHDIPFLSLKVISDDAGPGTRATAVGQAAKWSKILGEAVYDILERIWI